MSDTEALTPGPEGAAGLRLFVGSSFSLAPGLLLDLPEQAARHAQVRRIQPGDTLRVFDGQGLDWTVRVLDVGRKQVRVELGAPQAVALELQPAVTLALVVPANERMDSLVEKATELGVATIQPLMAERSVLRLQGERAERRQAHWQAVAVAACEQCGRARVPAVAPVQPLQAWLQALKNAQRPGPPHARWLLSLRPGAQPLPARATGALQTVTTLSGPEGGLSADEEQAAMAAGFEPVNLGPRVLRADTAPLAVLSWLSLQATQLHLDAGHGVALTKVGEALG
jgi:16S rRNA (uracil1498-N3)-methyltransferase